VTILVRAVAAEDLATVARLHATCFPEDGWDATALAGILAMRGAAATLAEDDRALRGLLFAVMHETEAEILTLGVHPRARRRGIGRALLDDLFARADTLGIAAVVLEVAADNAPALRLYRFCGFVAAGRRPGYYRRREGNADAWLLRRELLP
jgi:[ribosomal protein S18]-alanine N-acetyltransferase